MSEVCHHGSHGGNLLAKVDRAARKGRSARGGRAARKGRSARGGRAAREGRSARGGRAAREGRSTRGGQSVISSAAPAPAPPASPAAQRPPPTPPAARADPIVQLLHDTFRSLKMESYFKKTDSSTITLTNDRCHGCRPCRACSCRRGTSWLHRSAGPAQAAGGAAGPASARDGRPDGRPH